MFFTTLFCFILLDPVLIPSVQCGQKILGGNEATPHSIPYQVSLQIVDYNNHHFCSGVLVTVGAVLTSGQCCTAFDSGNIRVAAGKHHLDQEEETEQLSHVLDAIIHPDFDSLTAA